MRSSEIVITGVGMVSPIGIGRDSFWNSLMAGRCGIGMATCTDLSGLPPQPFGQIHGFEAKGFVAHRKSLKVMARDAQLGVAAGVLACRDASIASGTVDPDRFGVVLGADQICARIEESVSSYGNCIVDGRFDFNLWGSKAIANSFPLGFLRVLPNMIASHVSISQDARGPNNTIHQGEMSGLLAVIEAASVIRRGMADIMLAGGASSQTHVFDSRQLWVQDLERHLAAVTMGRLEDRGHGTDADEAIELVLAPKRRPDAALDALHDLRGQ